jgi:hypothetical protein
LRRFGIAISVLNLLGHTVLGFEQAWAMPFIALATAYSTELLLEWTDACVCGRRPQFAGGLRRLVDFLLPAHISGLAVAMLLYSNSRPLPIAFAAAAAIASKTWLRMRAGNSSCHFFNPSNFGITLTLLLFPWVGIAQPYHFTENLSGAGDWILPGLIVCTGSFLNYRFTKRLPLIVSWLTGFVAQALARHWFLGANFAGALMPMSGVAFILYTFYMVTDPATTPSRTWSQVVFGAGVATVYGLLMVFHIVFGLFFALSIVCAVRGAAVWAEALVVRRSPAPDAYEERLLSTVGS